MRYAWAGGVACALTLRKAAPFSIDLVRAIGACFACTDGVHKTDAGAAFRSFYRGADRGRWSAGPVGAHEVRVVWRRGLCPNAAEGRRRRGLPQLYGGA